MLELPARGDGQAPDVGAFAISRDGARLAVALDAPTVLRYDLYVAALGGASFAPVKVTALTAAGAPNPTLPMWWSPDGARIAVIADFLSGGAFNEPYVVEADGSTPAPRRLVDVTRACGGCSTPNATMMQWTTDGAALYVLGDLATNNDTEVFRVDPALADQAPVLAVDVTAGGDVLAVIVRPE